MKLKKFNENYEEDFDSEEDEINIEGSKYITKLIETPYKGNAKWMKGKTFYSFHFDVGKIDKERRYIGDGVYDISNIDFVEAEEGFRFTDKSKRDKVVRFILENENNLYYASAYQCYAVFFLNGKPNKLPNGDVMGDGFNHGSSNIIKNCPEKILILAEDD